MRCGGDCERRQLTTNLYVLALAQRPGTAGTATSVPQWLGWLSGDSVLALYEDRAVLYGANGGEKASYDFGGSTLWMWTPKTAAWPCC